ncbi:MAG: tetratricopeptide repeat protein [Planctomycetota bacterium]
MSKIQAPEFFSLEEFIRWWQTPDIQQSIRDNSGLVAEYIAEPHIEPWINKFLKTCQETTSKPPLSKKDTLIILTMNKPEDKEFIDNVIAQYKHSKKPPADNKTVIANRYRIIKKLGSGGMGIVYFAYDSVLNINVALKILKSDESEETERFLREARSVAKLDYPGIVRVQNAGSDDSGQYYIAMQYIDGRALDELLHLPYPEDEKQEKRPDNPIDNYKLVKMFSGVADALAYAHENGIVHRDIKPGNVLIDKKDKSYLADFGLAKELKGKEIASLTQSGIAIGTPYYMSPEQAEGKSGKVTYASDIFSFGAMMYHAFCRRVPFYAENLVGILNGIIEDDPPAPKRLCGSIPSGVEAIIIKCLEKNPKKRYRNATELSADLQRFLSEEPVSAHPLTAFHLFIRKLRKKKITLIVTTIVIVALILLLQVIRTSSQRSVAIRTAKELYLESEELLNSGQYDKAMSLIDQSLGKYETAEAIELKQRIEKAIEKAKEKIKTEQESFIIKKAQELYEKAEESLKTTNVYKAVEFATRSLEIDKNFAGAIKLKTKLEAIIEEKSKREAIRKKAEQVLSSIFIAGTLEEKLTILDNAIKTDPAWLMPYITKGTILEEANRYEEAIKTFKQSIDVARNDNNKEGEAAAHFHIGLMLWKQNSRSEAVARFKEVMNLMPDVRNTMTLYAESITCFEEGDFKAEKKLLDEILKLNPNFAEAYNDLGIIKRLAGDTDGAIAYYEKAIQLNPKFAEAYYNRGLAFFENGEIDKAVADFSKAIECNPEFILPYKCRGAIYERKKEFVKAIADFTKIIELDPNNAEAYSDRGLVLCKNGNIDEAIENFNKAIKLNPNLAPAYVNRGTAFSMKCNYKKGIIDFNKAIEFDQSDPLLYHLRGIAYLRTGDFNKAVADFSKTLELNPDLICVYGYRGIARAKNGDLKGAKDDLDILLSHPEQDQNMKKLIEELKELLNK